MRIAQILSFLDDEGIPYTFSGRKEELVEQFSSLHHYKLGSFTWIKTQKNILKNFDLLQIKLAFVSEDIVGDFQNVIRTPQHKRAFFSTIEHFYVQEEERPAIGQFTYISPKVKLGKNVRIGYNCTLDGDITIGDGTTIWNNVTIINRVTIGKNCEIQSGAVIGQDGFAYTEDDAGRKQMVKHFGGVYIGNDVLIGSNACVCCGTIDDTVISDGTKIDNMCHIAHNCVLEENVALAYPCQLGGSTHIEKNGYLAAATVRNQSIIGEGSFVGLGAVVVKDIDAHMIVAGVPAKPFKKRD